MKRLFGSRWVVVGSLVVIVLLSGIAVSRMLDEPESAAEIARRTLEEIKRGDASTLSRYADPNEQKHLPTDENTTEELLAQYVLPAFRGLEEHGSRTETVQSDVGVVSVRQYYETPQGTRASLVVDATLTPDGVRLQKPLTSLLVNTMHARHSNPAHEFRHEGWLKGAVDDGPMLTKIGYAGRFVGDEFVTWEAVAIDLRKRIETMRKNKAQKRASEPQS